MTHEQHSTLPTGDDDRFDYDVIVVGSGFGGSVSALRLTEKGYRVGVLEAGRRFTRETLPKNSWDLRNFLWAPGWGSSASSASTCCATSWCWPGPGSAAAPSTTPTPSTSRRTPSTTTRSGATSPTGGKNSPPYYDQAKRMLGVRPNPTVTPADVHLQAAAEAMGVGYTFHLAPVGVFFGDGEDAAATSRSRPASGARPLLRRRRARPARLPRVRGVHDRLPARRQKHPRPRTTCTSRSGRRRRPPHDHRDRAPRAADPAAATRSPPWPPRFRTARRPHVHRPPGRARRRHLRHADAPARHARRGPAARHLPQARQAHPHQLRGPRRRPTKPRYRGTGGRRTSPRAWRSPPPCTLTRTPTSSRSATARAPTRWAAHDLASPRRRTDRRAGCACSANRRATPAVLRSLSVRRWSERTIIGLVMQSLDNSLTTYRKPDCRRQGPADRAAGPRRAQPHVDPGGPAAPPADRRADRRLRRAATSARCSTSR